jgi:gliding motility-associated-like protein
LKKVYLILILTIFSFLQTVGQQFTGAKVFGGAGIQFSGQNFFDKIGNHYQVIGFQNLCKVDSNGYEINIPNINGLYNYAVIKFDSLGNYQYNFRFNYNSNADIAIHFDQNNNLYLLFSFSQKDSILLYNKNGQLYKKIKAQYRKRTGESSFFEACVLAKLNTNGDFLWCNTIYNELIPIGDINRNLSLSISTKQNSEIIKLFYPNIRLKSGSADTICLLNTNNVKSIFMVHSQQLVLNFSTNGDLLTVKEPFKNKLQFDQKDSLFTSLYTSTNYRKEVKVKTDGINNYVYLNLYFNKVDTFNSNPKIPFSRGNVYFLCKLDENDSILWLKPLYKEIDNSTGLRYACGTSLNIDTNRNDLIFYLYFAQDYYLSLFKPSLNVNTIFGQYIIRLNNDGNIIKEDSLANGLVHYNSSYNSHTNQRVSIGQINGADPKILPFLPPDLKYKFFSGVLIINDSSNDVSSVIPIISNSTQLSSNLTTHIFNTYNETELLDSRGKIFASGSFKDSIQLACSRIYSTVTDIDAFGNKIYDAFTLTYEPPKEIPVNACSKYVSPSGKYLWDTSGIYFDTVPNMIGCDSILKLKIRFNSNFLQIDTSVKYFYTSPFGKFTFDSTGLYFDSLTNKFGCDSIIKFNINVLSSKSLIDTFNCNPIKYLSKNEWIKQSGFYRDTIPNLKGGDSLISIHFTLGFSKSQIDTSFCDKIISPSSKYTWSVSGTYLDTIQNQQLCDSIITVNYVRTISTDTIKIISCDSFLVPSGKSYLSKTAWYSDTLKTQFGCDSFLTINFTRLITTAQVSISTCDSVKSPSGKFYLSTTGIYSDTLKTQLGCDSFLLINYTRLNTSSAVSISSCDSIISPSGKYIYHLTGTYQDTLKNQLGCDSIITIQLFIPTNNLKLSKSNDIDCENQSAQLFTNETGLKQFMWSPDVGLNDKTSPNPIVKPKSDIFYYVIAKDSLGCLYNDSIFLKVEFIDSLGFFPNVFTPNGDGLNDCLPMNSMSEFSSLNFFVYNRWGDLVFETTNIKECWKGQTQNGEPLSEGTYFYLLSGITTCNKEISNRGTVTIIR